MKIPENPLRFQDQAEWRRWLKENHAAESEAWLFILKSNVSEPGVSYEEAVEEAVCFGWIDGLTKSFDAYYFLQRFSPRKRGSPWSISNQNRVERLIAQGRMNEAGMQKVREAKESGEWDAAIRREQTSELPEDLRAALKENAEAGANFEKYSVSQKKMFLYWINSAKTDKTRQKRIKQMVEMVANNQRIG